MAGNPGSDTVTEADAEQPVRIAFCLQEERGALRLFPDRPRGWPLLLQGGQRWLRSPRPLHYGGRHEAPDPRWLGHIGSRQRSSRPAARCDCVARFLPYGRLAQ